MKKKNITKKKQWSTPAIKSKLNLNQTLGANFMGTSDAGGMGSGS